MFLRHMADDIASNSTTAPSGFTW